MYGVAGHGRVSVVRPFPWGPLNGEKQKRNSKVLVLPVLRIIFFAIFGLHYFIEEHLKHFHLKSAKSAYFSNENLGYSSLCTVRWREEKGGVKSSSA